MKSYPEGAIEELSKQLQIETEFIKQCVHESSIELSETQAGLEMSNGTALRLRRLQRICETFEIELPIAVLLCELTHRIADLENELKRLRSRQ